MLTLVQLDSTGTWSLRNEDGDRVGYFAIRADAHEWLAANGYSIMARNAIGSSWERTAKFYVISEPYGLVGTYDTEERAERVAFVAAVNSARTVYVHREG